MTKEFYILFLQKDFTMNGLQSIRARSYMMHSFRLPGWKKSRQKKHLLLVGRTFTFIFTNLNFLKRYFICKYTILSNSSTKWGCYRRRL